MEIEVTANVEPVISLKQQIKDVKKEIDEIAGADVIDESKLQDAVNRMAELKDRTADVNEQVSILTTGSKFEAVSNSIGQMKDALFALDFDKLNDRAKSFSENAKKISFKDASNSFKSLGKTMFTIGKTMLTNPMFILGSVIGLIVNAIIDLMKEFGIFEQVIKIATLPLTIMIDALRSLMEWLGFTSKTSEEEAEKMAEAQEAAAQRVIDSFDKQEQKISDFYSGQENDINNELKLLRARSDGSEESVQAIIDAERRLLLSKQSSLQAQIKNDEKLLEVMNRSGLFSKAQIDEQIRNVNILNQQLKSASTDIEAFDIKTEKDATKRGQDSRKRNSDARKKSDEEERKRVEEKNKFILDTNRMLEDIIDQSIINEEEKADAISKRKAQRAKEDFENSKFYQKLLVEDKIKAEKILQSYQDSIDEVDKNRKKVNAEKEREHLTNLNNLKLELRELNVASDDWTERESIINEEYRLEEEALRNSLENKQLTKEEYDAKLLISEKNKNNELGKLSDERADKEKENALIIAKAEEDLQNAKNEAFMAGLDLLGTIFSGNEKIQKAIFAIEQGKAAADVVVNGLKTNGLLVASLAAGVGTMNPAQVLAAKAAILMNKIGMATSLAGIAAVSIDKFKGGKSSPPQTPTPSDGSGGSGGSGSSFDRTSPTVSFNQNPNAGNVEDFTSGGGGSNINLNNTISISETEITDVQKRNLKLKNNATL
jgi:hypothetical protein